LYEFVLLVGITTLFRCSFSFASRCRISFILFVSGWPSDLSSSVKSRSATSIHPERLLLGDLPSPRNLWFFLPIIGKKRFWKNHKRWSNCNCNFPYD
jgi:hypothetical protein